MLDIQLQEVNNGFVVNVQLIHKLINPIPVDFNKIMQEGVRAMTKEMNKDTVLSEIEEKNKKEEDINNYIGVHVFVKYSEVLSFLSLLKD